MISFIITSSLLMFSAYASFDLLLPPIPPSGLDSQKDSRAKFTEAIDKTLYELRNLPLTDDQWANLYKLLFVYIKALAFIDCAPDFVAVGKCSVIVDLIFYTLEHDIVTRELESDLINWNIIQNEIKNSDFLFYLLHAGNHLYEIIRSFEMLFPADSKDLEEYIGDKAVYSKVLTRFCEFKHKYEIKNLEPLRGAEIYKKIVPLQKKLADSLFSKDKLLIQCSHLFEPLKGQFGLKNWAFTRFSFLFLDYALVAFYEEHFRSNQELAETLFGTGVQLTDLNEKEINWCFEISSLSKKYLLELKKEFPFIEDDDILTQLKRAMFDLLEPHKTHPSSFVVNLEQTRYFSLSNK
jgi:hypothetical protein